MRANNVLGILFSDSYSDKISNLTALRTTGSVPFGGRYRFIDFILSDLVNCGISKVGVITKSNYRSLMDHLGTGKPWDLSRKNEGLFLLPPFNRKEGNYSGKIEALAHIQDFIHLSKEELVILCDTNIICNMDFGKLIDFHLSRNSDITIAYKNGVYPNLENTMRLTLGENEKITKISVPNQYEAGEGNFGVNIIIMRKSLLERLLNAAVSENALSVERDIFKANVDKLNMFGYKIDSYCAVIDSMQTYFDTSMALLNKEVRTSLFNTSNPIYTKVYDDMPSVYGIGSEVKNSLIADGCRIEGTVENSLLFRGVHVAKGAYVKNCIIMQSGYIGDDSRVNCVVMDKHGVIRARKDISGDASYPIYIGKKIII